MKARFKRIYPVTRYNPEFGVFDVEDGASSELVLSEAFGLYDLALEDRQGREAIESYHNACVGQLFAHSGIPVKEWPEFRVENDGSEAWELVHDETDRHAVWFRLVRFELASSKEAHGPDHR